MPRKSKRAQAQSLRRSAEINCAANEQTDGVPSVPDADGVKQGGQSSPCVPQVSYADVVKRSNPPVAGPSDSEQVNRRVHSDDPGVQQVSHADIAMSCESGIADPSNSKQVNHRVQSDDPGVQQVSHADMTKRRCSSEPSIADPSNSKQVNHRGQGNEPRAAQPSYADMVQRRRVGNDQCVAGPPQADMVNTRDQLDELNLSASRSQASLKYGQSRNKQCTCNSLTFLAFLCENENMTRADLDSVLDKGNVMYRMVRKRVPNHIHLTTDELPDLVPARRLTHIVDMSLLSRYGTFGDPSPEAVDYFLDLESGLSCLLSDVQYALLLMSSLCIAVFRTRSGRYGFFDPHARTVKGLPILHTTPTPGTAVMVTFTRLSDMIDRLTKYHKMLGTAASCTYELKPVQFPDVNYLSDVIPATESQPPTHTVPTTVFDETHPDEPTTSDPQMNTDVSEITVLADMETDPEPLSSVSDTLNDDMETDVSDHTSQRTCPNITSSSTVNQPEVHEGFPNTHTEPEPARGFSLNSDKSQDCPPSEALLTDPLINIDTSVLYDISHDIFSKLSKLGKEQRRKFKMRLMHSENLSQRKENQKRKERVKYALDEKYKAKKKSYSSQRYSKEELRKAKQKNVTNHYRNNPEIQKKKINNIKTRYRESTDFRLKRKASITRKYRDSVEFKDRQKKYITRKYRNSVEFKDRQKTYIKRRYTEDIDFRQRQRSYFTQRYAHDEVFRVRHRQLMRQIMRDRTKNSLHKMRCALKISRKYRQISRHTCEPDRESENPMIREAIAAFRSHIKDGPTYVCTVCHKASFPNQVKPCKRSSYVKHPRVVAACLTGQYVHACDDDCRNNKCTVPDERKREWICHTCHEHLKNGAMPKLAVANNLGLADIPPELCDLNILERHLIAKCITFAKIIPLPKGRQRAIHGNVVCVPSEVQETIDALPRLRSESQVLRVKLKRRLTYRGHHLFQTVTWSKLIQALHKLKEIHPQYEDITIRDEEDLCDPTVPDDDGDDDDGVTMAEEDYDEDDLMEIDRFETDAMCEAEIDNENTELCDEGQTQENDDDGEPQQEGDMPHGGVVLESCLQPRDVSEEILCFSDSTYSVAPAERNSPVSFFKTPKLEAMAFPVQFPTGENTLDENRPMKLTPGAYFKARLFGVDDRFARDTNYLFFAQFVAEIHVATSSMTIQLRKGKPFTRDGRKITSRMLRDKHEVERLVRNRDAIRFMQPLRGTPAYWDKTTKDLFAMIRQLGSPTFFVTFSAAEMRWPEVIIAIKAQQGEEVNFDELDWSTKCDILRSNPVTVMRVFDKRVEALYRDLILSAAQPLGKVYDFFWRLEFQHRGSPHIHGLLWVDGAPVFEKDSDKTVCDFVSKYISARLPDPDKQPDLFKKVTEVQIHSKNHSKTCFKSASSGCRFGFPKPPSRRTMITRPVDDVDSERLKAAKEKLAPLNQLLNKPETASLSFEQLLSRCDLTPSEFEQHLHLMSQSCSIILKRDPKDCWVNPYNPHLLEAWDANIDVQFVLSYHSLIRYICTYMCKSENSVSQYLQTLIQNSDRDCVNERDEMKAIMQAYSKKREISAQEAVARVTSLNMKKSSRAVVFISTDDNPVKMSLPVSSLDNTTADCVNVWMTSITDKYKARPETPEFEEMCMADFASTCRLVYGQQTKGKNVVPLLNELGFVQRRGSENHAVIRYRRISKEKYPEQFYGTLLRLYLPYRSDQELKRPFLPTYESFHERGIVQLLCSDRPQYVKVIVKRNKEKYEKNSEEIETAIEDFEQNRGVVDEWCNLAPESEVVRLECIDELDSRQPDPENVQENVPEYNKQADAAPEARVMREPPAVDPTQLRQMYQSLNQKQACVFYAVRDWCFKRVCGLHPEQFFYYINGGAGTGKSHLIKCIYSEASKILSKVPRRAEEADISTPTVLLTAFTGTAAFNISGTTLHSLLKLPRSLKPPFQGLGNKLDEIRCELLNAEILVIDEVSMVSKALFAYVDVRLKQIKGSHRPFGGMSVLAVGDFYQLPPVRQSKPLCVFDPREIDLWTENFQMVTLNEIMRQKDDLVFAEMLNRLRVKNKSDELSEADRALLSQRITEPELCPTDVLHIFATNRQVDTHNSATLSLLHYDITSIDADDFKKDQHTGHMKRQGAPCKGGRSDLPDTLTVAVGVRVMLTRNIDVSQGLVNGSFATVGKVVNTERNDSSHVTMLGLRMDDETAGGSYRSRGDNLVYIDRSEEALKHKGVVRRQFPVKLAFACTIHKVQGMTKKSAVVSLKHIFEPGMAYVAISRVTSLSGLHILDLDESKIHANPHVSVSLETMRQANLDHMMPLLQIQHSLSRHDTVTIVHHNTEGLPSHVNDIKSHHELCLADVLCLTETHLQGSFVADSLQLEGYTMFRRNRHLSYSNVPQMASRGGGGVAVYVRNHLQVLEKQYITNVTDLEFVALKVEAPVSALIAAVYRPPDYSLTSFLSNVGSLLDSLEIMDCHPIIVCGDFNENLSSNASKPILDFFQSKGYAQLITTGTTDKNTLLDLIFISRPQHCLHSGVMQTYYSYHNPVYCVISSNRP